MSQLSVFREKSHSPTCDVKPCTLAFARQQPKPFRLLSLPPELQLLILGFSLHIIGSITLDISNWPDRKTHNSSPSELNLFTGSGKSIGFVHKSKIFEVPQLHDLAVEAFLAENIFCLNQPDEVVAFDRWLTELPLDGHAKIRHLQFVWDYKSVPWYELPTHVHEQLELISRCTGLIRVEYDIRVDNVELVTEALQQTFEDSIHEHEGENTDTKEPFSGFPKLKYVVLDHRAGCEVFAEDIHPGCKKNQECGIYEGYKLRDQSVTDKVDPDIPVGADVDVIVDLFGRWFEARGGSGFRVLSERRCWFPGVKE